MQEFVSLLSLVLPSKIHEHRKYLQLWILECLSKLEILSLEIKERKGPGKIIRSHSDPQNTPVQIKATENHVLGVGFSKVFALVPIIGYCKIMSEGGSDDQY